MKLYMHEQGSKFQQFNTNPSAVKENSALAKRQLRMVHQIEQMTNQKTAQALNQPAYTLDDSLKQMLRQLQAENVKEELQTDAGPMEPALAEDGTDALDDREECPYVPSGEVELPFAGKPTEEIQDEAILEIISQLKRLDNYMEGKITICTDIDYEYWEGVKTRFQALPKMPSGGSDMFELVGDTRSGHLTVRCLYLDILKMENETGDAFNIISEQYGQMRKYVEAIDDEKYGERAKQALISELDNHFVNILSSIFANSKLYLSQNEENFNAVKYAVERFEMLYAQIDNGVGKNYNDQIKERLLDKLKTCFKNFIENVSVMQAFSGKGYDPATDLQRYQKAKAESAKAASSREFLIQNALRSVNWNSAETVLKTLGHVKSLYK